jgi:hypothetical protein
MEAADWVSLGDEELLERRISKLGLRIEDTPLEPLVRQLYDENPVLQMIREVALQIRNDFGWKRRT